MWGMTLPKMAAAVHSFSAILGKVAGHSHTAQAQSSMKTWGHDIVKNHGSLPNAKQYLNKLDYRTQWDTTMSAEGAGIARLLSRSWQMEEILEAWRKVMITVIFKKGKRRML